MYRVFQKLFRYTDIYETYGNIHFVNISLHKTFPDEDFVVGNDTIKAVIDPVNGTVLLSSTNPGTERKSKTVKIQDWIDSDGLRRTDTQTPWTLEKVSGV